MSLFRSPLRSGLLAIPLVVGFLAPAALEADPLDAVVEIRAQVPANARTAGSLGTNRTGSGILIDDEGLILTIGYLIMEALEIEVGAPDGGRVPAEVVAYDHESGLGLIRAASEIEATPAELGSADPIRPRQPLLAASRVGSLDAQGVFAVDRRTFAGYWEYLLENAIFTAPPLSEFGGAALFNEAGQLVGVGSLVVGNAMPAPRPVPGNMFIPIDQLQPILGDLLTHGRRSGPPRPWIGAHFEEHRGHVFVIRTEEDGPADTAGMAENDVVVGVAGEPVSGLEDFYRSLWDQGEAGVEVEVDVVKGVEVMQMPVRSLDRYRWLRLDPTF